MVQYVVVLLSVIEIVTLYFVALVVVVPEPDEDANVVAVVESEALVVAVVESVADPLDVVGDDTEIDCLNPRLLTGAKTAKVCEPEPKLLGKVPLNVTRPDASAFSVSSTCGVDATMSCTHSFGAKPPIVTVVCWPG